MLQILDCSDRTGGQGKGIFSTGVTSLGGVKSPAHDLADAASPGWALPPEWPWKPLPVLPANAGGSESQAGQCGTVRCCLMEE